MVATLGVSIGDVPLGILERGPKTADNEESVTRTR